MPTERTTPSDDTNVNPAVNAHTQPVPKPDADAKAEPDAKPEPEAEHRPITIAEPKIMLEVIVDNWGAEGKYSRGDQFEKSTVDPEKYDVDWAIESGALKVVE